VEFVGLQAGVARIGGQKLNALLDLLEQPLGLAALTPALTAILGGLRLGHQVIKYFARAGLPHQGERHPSILDF
jgi:hypothetical protein